jgi:S1-C subfamily serine protease
MPMQVAPVALPEVGSDVYVIGHPVGLGWTITRGIVSAVRKAGEIAPIEMIQTDAAISPGNSGGPLLNRYGQLVGVVVSKFAGPGIESVGFAIPVSQAAAFIAQSERAGS